MTIPGAPTREQWLAAVDKVLKGKDFDRTLVTTTLDDLRIEPLYAGTVGADESGFPGFDPLTRGTHAAPRPHGQWDIRTRVTHPDIATANSQILEDLSNGATSVEVLLTLGPGPGVSIRSEADLARVLNGVVLEAAPVSLRAGAHAQLVAGWFRGIAQDAAGCLGVDPVAALVTSGTADLDLSWQPGRLRTVMASGAPASDAGASEAQELGYLLAVGTHYLREGVPAEQITLEITADVDIFATVAKLRALRHCWATVLRELGQPLESVQIVAVSADRWLTRVDPWVNLLRGTAATVGAVVGGADTVTIAPFDSAAGLPGDLGRRMARNTQLVLQDEAGIGRVLDPAGGSWYVENITDDLAGAGWRYFQRIEGAGGVLAALDEIGTDIAVVADRRARDIATRKRPITGVSEFPLLDEKRPDPVAMPAPDDRPAIPVTGVSATPWPGRRLAEPFEQLRERADRTVYLACLGPASDYTPRATFAANLFAAVGIRTVAGPPEDFHGTDLACICGSQDSYVDAAAVARDLRAAGATYVYLAGKGEYDGVDEYLHLGVNVLEALHAV